MSGTSHELEKVDIWNGYFIPKGAYIHTVEWFVLGALEEIQAYTYAGHLPVILPSTQILTRSIRCDTLNPAIRPTASL